MATTRFWPIKGTGKNLMNVLAYCENPEKTMPSEMKNSLKDVISYAGRDVKTEHCLYVSGKDCSTNNTYEDFINVKKQFGKTEGVQCYHGYMSFDEGEVTPDEAHAIGLEFAHKNFGSFQVLVATHLDTGIIHNHFIVNSVSYEDGRRIHDEVTWFKFRKLADRICAGHGKSVVVKPKRGKVNEFYRREENAGRNESYNIIRRVLDEAVSVSGSLEDLRRELKAKGYRYNLSPNRKYWTVTPAGYERGIRLYRLGEEYTNAAIMERLAENKKTQRNVCAAEARFTGFIYKKYTGKPGMLVSLYRHYMYLLGIYSTTKSAYGIPHAVRQDINMLQRISKEAVYLEKNNITMLSELVERTEGLQNSLAAKIKERTDLRNELRRSDSGNPENTRKEISMVTDAIAGLRKEIRMCENIKKRSIRMEENISEENFEERKDKNERSRTGDADSGRRNKDNA